MNGAEAEADGHLPLLGELVLPFPHRLLTHSVNPRMDLACLVSIDPSSAASSTGAHGAAGGKLSATQAARARLIAMARARAIGGAAAAAAAAAGDGSGAAANGEPKRGPHLLVGLYRMEGSAARVWQVALPVQPTLFESLKSPDGKFIEEEETASVGDVAWSPDGTRLALSLTYTRTKVGSAPGPSSQAAQARHAHLLQVLSVQNGTQVSAIATSTREGPGMVRKLQWTAVPAKIASKSALNGSSDATSAPFSLTKIHGMDPLPVLDVAALEKVGTSQNSAMPHYMRAQQQLAGIGSAGAAAQQAIDSALPSEQARLTGRGPLARLGSLFGPTEVYDSGLVGRKGKARSGPSTIASQSEVRHLSVLTALADSADEEQVASIEFVLDGTISLGAILPRQTDTKAAWRPVSLNLAPGLAGASMLIASDESQCLRTIYLHLPFSEISTSPSGSSAISYPSAIGLIKTVAPPTFFHPALHLARLGSYLRLYLAYALDAAALCSKIWAAETGRPKARYTVDGNLVSEPRSGVSKPTTPGTGGTAEWVRLLDEVAKNEGADATADLLIVLLTGRASTAMESALLNTITQGMLRNMEATSTDSLSSIRRVCADSILPACERIQMLVSEVRGSQRFGPLFTSSVAGGLDTVEQVSRLSALYDASETAAKLCRKIMKQAEWELLALDEFYKWWRYERERQDYLRNHKEDPHLAIVHDVLAVSEFVHRGFVNPALAACLDGGRVEEPSPASMPSLPSGLGITMDLDGERSAVLGGDGRVVAQDDSDAQPHPNTDEEMVDNQSGHAVTQAPGSTLQDTLSSLKSRLLDNRRLGASIVPRFPQATRQQHAARMQAKQVFAGPATDFDGDGDQAWSKNVPNGFGAAQTLEGTLWQLARGLSDILDSALQRTMSAYTGIQLGPMLPLAALGFAGDATVGSSGAMLTSAPTGAKSGAEQKGTSNERWGSCIVKQRLVEHADGNSSRATTKAVLLGIYVTAFRPGGVHSQPEAAAPRLVLTRQEMDAAAASTETVIEATCILLPSPVLSADFLSDDEALLLFPRGAADDRVTTVQTSCTLQTLDLLASYPFQHISLGHGSDSVPLGTAPIPTTCFEPRRSFKLVPNVDASISHLGPSSSKAGGAAGSSGGNQEQQSGMPGCVWSISAERATAISVLPLPASLVDAIHVHHAAVQSRSDSQGQQQSSRERTYDEASGRVMQYWDLTDL
ncbi:hypothetical protein OC842_000448 [Tilletia horrida]|uniref:Anaphase-promoting complex subunit 4 n=1 Tax=Tilletia horrida TaxID=155126 RepID=A0AAN6JN47_9BASI|nr:hypothetical protein OC842_000448 [Tilletia horrida]